MSRPVRRKPILSDSGPPLSPLPPPVKPLTGAMRLILPLLLVLYLTFAGLHAQWVPHGQTGYQNAPDEAAHVVYVRKIASGHLPTLRNSANDPQGYEWHQPPLYYFGAARFLPFGVLAVRWFSIVCGLAGILLIYRTAQLLFPNEPLVALVAAGIAALTPSHIAITSVVNNDGLLELCCSGAVFGIVCALRSGFTLWRAGWIGVAIGAACLTKATGLVLIPVLLFALIFLRRNGEKPGELAWGTGWSLLVAFAISGWWFIRNAVLYHEVLPVKAFERAFAGTVQARDMAAALGGWDGYVTLLGRWTFQSFWAVYGDARSATIGKPLFLPDAVYTLLAFVTLTMTAGLTRQHFRRKTDYTELQRSALWILFALLGLVSLSFGGFVLKYFQAQGRYFYPAMLPIAILGAVGWQAVFPAKYKGMASGMLLTLLGAFSVVFLLTIAPK